MIEIRELSLRYNGIEMLNIPALDLQDGVSYGVVGGVGAGKTSFFKVLTNMYVNYTGTVKINGEDIRMFPEALASVGTILDDFSFYQDQTGWFNIEYFVGLYGKQQKSQARQMAQYFGIEGMLNKLVKTYSQAVKQRLELLITLLKEPRILILDDPFDQLEPTNALWLKNYLQALKKNGLTLFISTTNDEDLIGLCDGIFYMFDGQIIDRDTYLSMEQQRLALKEKNVDYMNPNNINFRDETTRSAVEDRSQPKINPNLYMPTNSMDSDALFNAETKNDSFVNNNGQNNNFFATEFEEQNKYTETQNRQANNPANEYPITNNGNLNKEKDVYPEQKIDSSTDDFEHTIRNQYFDFDDINQDVNKIAEFDDDSSKNDLDNVFTPEFSNFEANKINNDYSFDNFSESYQETESISNLQNDFLPDSRFLNNSDINTGIGQNYSDNKEPISFESEQGHNTSMFMPESSNYTQQSTNFNNDQIGYLNSNVNPQNVASTKDFDSHSDAVDPLKAASNNSVSENFYTEQRRTPMNHNQNTEVPAFNQNVFTNDDTNEPLVDASSMFQQAQKNDVGVFGSTEYPSEKQINNYPINDEPEEVIHVQTPSSHPVTPQPEQVIKQVEDKKFIRILDTNSNAKLVNILVRYDIPFEIVEHNKVKLDISAENWGAAYKQLLTEDIDIFEMSRA